MLQTLNSRVDALQIWRFNGWVKDQLEPVMEELHDMPAPRMAFHIRGGDKLSEDVQLVRRHQPALKPPSLAATLVNTCCPAGHAVVTCSAAVRCGMRASER